MDAGGGIPLPLLVGTGVLTVCLATGLAYVLRSSSSQTVSKAVEEEKPSLDRSKYPGGKIIVCYATQTGTAESFARQLEREGPAKGFFIQAVDLEDMTLDDLEEGAMEDPETGITRLVIVAATYGEGEPTDNATMLSDVLRERAGIEILFHLPGKTEAEPQVSLSKVEFCVFGLGNRQYDHFNAMAKFFNESIGRIGGSRIMPLGEGDDDKDLEGDFETWKDNEFWPTMEKRYLPEGAAVANGGSSSEQLQMPTCPYVAEYLSTNGKTQPEDIPLAEVHGSSRHYFTAQDCPVTALRELRSKDDAGSTVHMEIDISQAKDLTYMTADNLGVLPVNESSLVESVAECLGYDLDAAFRLSAAPDTEWHGAPFPMPLTIRECLSRYLDISSAPRRSDLKLLAAYATDPVDQQFLSRISSKEAKEEYKEKILEDYIGLAQLLKRCPSIRMPLEHFVSLCPPLQTRFFTISSSSSVHPTSVHLTVAVTNAKRGDGSIFNGVCSTHLAQRQTSQMVRVYNRPSSFRLPADASKPILMIGPGTGVAPMRALLQERQYLKQTKKQKVGKNILYFGCKKRTLDYLYQDELAQYQKNKTLDQLHVAFSRETSQKVYVQHLLKKNAKQTWDLVHKQGAYVYVCGAVQMGHDVSVTLQEIAVEQGKLSADAAKEYMTKLASDGRYVQELWA